MDFDNLFQALSTFSQKDIIKEVLSIKKFLNNIPVKDSKIIKTKKKHKIPYVLLQLEDNRKILFKEIPLNFFLSFGFILGEDTDLIEVKLKNEEQNVIIEKRLQEELSFEIEKVLDKVNPYDIYLKKIRNPNNNNSFLKELRGYISSQKKINLNKIHLVKGDKLELFNPTVKYKHFKIARLMNIPLISLIKDNFIIQSNINIFDYKSQLSTLDVYKLIEEEIIVELFENKETYRDISLEYYIKLDHEEILNKLNNIKKTNVDINNLSKKLYGVTGIQISQNFQGDVLPLFKEKSKRKFYPLKSTEEFFNITGVYFKNDIEILKRIIIVNEIGEELFYRGKYLNQKLEFIFNKEKIFEKEIEFENITELLIKIILIDNPKELIFIEKVKGQKKNEFEKRIRQIQKRIKEISIKNATIPRYSLPILFEEKIFSDLSNKIKNIKDEFLMKKITLNQVVNILNKDIYNINFILNKVESNPNILSHIFEIYKNSMFFLKFINKDLYKSINEETQEIFKIKQPIYNYQGFKDLNLVLKDIVLLWKLYKKYNIKLELRNEIETNLIPLLENEIGEKSNSKQIKKEYKKINYKRLKENFKYNYKEIIKKIKEEKLRVGDNIKINGINIKIKEDYFKNINKNKVIENNYFNVIRIN